MRHAHGNANGDGHIHSNGNSDSNSNSDSYGYGGGFSYTYSDSYSWHTVTHADVCTWGHTWAVGYCRAGTTGSLSRWWMHRWNICLRVRWW